MWHHPRFSSGAEHGSHKFMADLWEILQQHGADVVLVGHEHLYERFAPQNPDGKADPRGIREFVVGTGGGGLYELRQPRPNSEVRNNRSYGVIKFTLNDTSYSWEFISAAGEPFKDSGTGECVK